MLHVPPGQSQQASNPPDVVMRPGQFIERSSTTTTPSSSVDFQTDGELAATYVAADATTVIDEVLGKFLKVDYSIAPDVSGHVTMRLDHIKTRLTAIEALRTALRPLGIAVIDRGDIVAIARASGGDGPVKAAAITPGEQVPAGSGVVVLTPKHITPSQLGPLIAPFSPGAAITGTDDNRRFLIIKGDEASINAASSAAAMFDVDWFTQVSTASFTLTNISPSEFISELKPLLGPAASSVDLVAVPRLSKVIVLARNPLSIPAIRDWVTKLDVPPAEIVSGLLIYHAKHMSADALASSLRDDGGAATSQSTLPTLSTFSTSSSSTQGARSLSGTVNQTSRSPGASSAPLQARLTTPPASSSRSGGNGSTSISVNLAQNLVIVRGDADQIAEARSLLMAMDQVPAQVLIQAAVVEITLNNDLEYGVNWSGVQDKYSETFTDAESGKVSTNFPGFALTYVNSGIEAALNLLSSITKVEVISRPTVVALQNEPASLQIGDQVPIVTQSAVSVANPDAPIVNQTTYRDTGIILNVVPHVRYGGVVDLEIAQEVSQVAKTTTSGIDSPTIQQRKISSRLLIPSGRSVALGGLISSSTTSGVTGVPILKDIPLLGHLFRSDNKSVHRTEMVVFLTPKILADSQVAADASEELRKSFHELQRDLLP
jgi:general secretion pathway protein D